MATNAPEAARPAFLRAPSLASRSSRSLSARFSSLPLAAVAWSRASAGAASLAPPTAGASSRSSPSAAAAAVAATVSGALTRAAAAAVSAAPPVGDVAAAAAAQTSPPLAVHESVLGRFPDYSVLIPTSEGSGWIDTLLHGFQLPFEALHGQLGLSWWTSIVAGALLIRLVTMRTGIKALRSGARMQAHMEDIQLFQQKMTDAQAGGDKLRMLSVRQDYSAFMKRNKISFFAAFAPILQIPLMIGMFWAVQRFARDGHLLPGFVDGGGAWFTALCAPDPTATIPAVAIICSIAALWINPGVSGIPQAELTPTGQRILFTSLAGLFSWVTFSFPAVRRARTAQQRLAAAPRLPPGRVGSAAPLAALARLPPRSPRSSLLPRLFGDASSPLPRAASRSTRSLPPPTAGPPALRRDDGGDDARAAIHRALRRLPALVRLPRRLAASSRAPR